jgi:hypothetical protein
MTIQIEPDKTVPFPEDLKPEVATTLRENMQIAANTAELLKGLGAEAGDAPEAQDQADQIFKDFSSLIEAQYQQAMTADAPPPPEKRGRGRPRKIHTTTQPSSSTAHLANPPTLYSLPVADRINNMLREYNNEFVADAAQLRQVVTNKLLDLASCGDPKIEIKATEMLGKISDVGLFSEKTEITVTYNNVSDLDAAIKDKVRKMLMAQGVTDVTPIDIDIDAEFGPDIIEAAPSTVETVDLASHPVVPATPAEEPNDAA